MSLQKRLRYRDLEALGLFTNRQTLKNAVDRYGFPPGALTGENSRTWGEADVARWIASRQTKPKPSPNPKRRPRGRRKHAAADHATSSI
jgi:hypothetical protein